MYALLLTIHIILATAASVHILLSKKQVRAAVSWLGISWLSPIIGSFIYFVFGINRVARRALKFRQLTGAESKDIRSAPVEKSSIGETRVSNLTRRVGDSLADFPLVDGNSMDIFQNGDEAYPEMLAAISAAEKTIALSSYIFRMDKNGRKFVQALADAKDRGVEVKVLIDGIGGGFLKCPAVTELATFGIDARRFLFSLAPWKMSYLNLRNHKKLLILDGKTAFVGGMNIGSENLLRRKLASSVRDTHFKFKGKVVTQLLHSFAEDWFFTAEEELTGEGWWADAENSGTVISRVINSGPDQEPGHAEAIFAAAIVGARERIRIVTPYFLPDEKLQYLLELAALRGVTIDIVVPLKTDFRIFDWAMQGQISLMNLKSINCRNSLQPFDHTKLFTVDGSWCAIGSPNWDARSMRLNFEILVECHGAKAVERVDRIIDEKIEKTAPYGRPPDSWISDGSRLRNAAARLLMPYL
ncbi:MAG: phospholipase D-like domain-containing protein [Rhizobiaceae bacterium]